jgi:hypothetical protein
VAETHTQEALPLLPSVKMGCTCSTCARRNPKKTIESSIKEEKNKDKVNEGNKERMRERIKRKNRDTKEERHTENACHILGCRNPWAWKVPFVSIQSTICECPKYHL